MKKDKFLEYFKKSVVKFSAHLEHFSAVVVKKVRVSEYLISPSCVTKLFYVENRSFKLSVTTPIPDDQI
jgi:hypothetical protein